MALFGFCITLSLQTTISTVINAVTLTPSDPNMDGVTVACTTNKCVIVNNHWLFSNLVINLDSSWDFHTTQLSTLLFTFHTNTSIPSFTFNINNSPYIVFNSNSSSTACTQNTFNNALQNRNTDKLHIDPPLKSSLFPLTLTITNNPITHRSFIVIASSHYTQTCAYAGSLTTDYGLQIHISSSEMIEFTQIYISYKYDTNSLPQIVPTFNPQIISLITADEGVAFGSIAHIGILLGVVLFLCCICLCVFFIIYKLRGRRRNASVSDTVVVQMHHNTSATNIEIAPDRHINDNIKQQRDMELALLAAWLENDVGLPQYYPLFIKHGYESTKFVSGIESKAHLKKIGVHVLGHQTLMWGQIKRLKKKYSKVHSGIMSTANGTTRSTDAPLYTDTNIYHFSYAPAAAADGRPHNNQAKAAVAKVKVNPFVVNHAGRKNRKVTDSDWGDASLPSSVLARQITPDLWGEHQTLPQSMLMRYGVKNDNNNNYDNDDFATDGFIQ